MTSGMAGDRRWGTARRGGMTVLGKVTVPKPVNLPSQRLENQGLDPNVEIVPKGTLSWGSKSTLNPWGSSSLSPRTDSGTGSPSHLSNRPSSGGTGTRPSTTGSEKGHEYSANAWGSNSRPSSASGVLSSNQASLAPLRPRSAETRPGSSHLSRFAEVAPENSVSWNQFGAVEKLGVAPANNVGFSLSSGDFPSLGTEKACSGRGTGPKDRGPQVRPSSSSGRLAAVEESGGNSFEGDASADAGAKSGDINSWRRDNQQYGEDGPVHGIEETRVDSRGPQPYPNASFPPPHHFDTWRGPPMNNLPGGVWYRGGHPYGPPLGPGGFPMDPFPYFPPHVPPAALANTQPVPGHGAGPRVNHPKNGDMYRPPMPDSYVRPGMPIRPGFYPGPVPYEGYYGPPLGYCNPNNRDVPFVGMAVGPYGYNKPSGQCGYDPTARSLATEKVEAGYFQETRGPYKVLLKPQEEWAGKDEGKREESVTNRVLNLEKFAQRRPSSSNNDRRTEFRKDRDIGAEGTFTGSDTSHVWEGGSSVKSKLPEHQVNFEACNDIQANKEEDSATGDPSLIQKIEGLNAKARTIDSWQNVNSENSAKVRTRLPQNIQAKTSKYTGPRGQRESVTSRNTELAAVSGTSISRRSTQGIQGRAYHQNKERVSNEDNDGWRNKAAVSGSSSAMSAENLESSPNVHIVDSLNNESVQKPEAYPLMKNEGESGITVDSSDSQRSWMRELAKQRALQRQKEEEERARDQRAKALAKLEELNRRTQAVGEDSTRKVEDASAVSIPDKPEDPGYISNPPLLLSSDIVAAEDLSLSTVANPSIAAERSEHPTGDTRKRASKEAMTSSDDANNTDTAWQDNLPCGHDGYASKQKRMGYKQQNPILEKRTAGNSRSIGKTDAVDRVPSPEVVSEVVSSRASNVPATSNISTESTHPRRKSNRNSKKKHKVEETTSCMDTSVHVMGKDANTGGESIESARAKVSAMESGSGSVPCSTDSKETADSAEQFTAFPNEEAQCRANNHSKSQHSRRIQRNLQGNKHAEKFHGTDAVMWAPVRTPYKYEITEEAAQKNVAESVFSTKSVNQAQSNPRSKRSEIERYVPKPIAKEMAQQGVSKKEVATSEISENVAQKESAGSAGAEISQLSGSTAEKIVSASESRNGNGSRQSKHGKGHGSCRQRGSVESTKRLEDDSSNSNQIVQKSMNHISHPPTVKIDDGPVREQTPSQDGWGDGRSLTPESHGSTAEKLDSTVPAISVAKDQGMTIRSKQQAFRGSKGGGINYADHKKANRGDANKVYIQHSGSESRVDSAGASKETRGNGERSASHWQPKTLTSVASNQLPEKAGGSESTGIETGGANKDSAVPSVHHSLHDKSNIGDAYSDEHRRPTRDQKATSLERRTHSQSQAPVNREAQSEQNSNSGFHKNGGQNQRVGRAHDSRGDWSSPSQDDWHRHQRPPSNKDKRRQSSHYEYQPVGAQGNPEQLKESSHNAVLRYREKGQQGHQRHGGERFYRQQKGSSRGDTG